MTRSNRKKALGKKGELFFDEGANRKLLNPTQEVGFKVHTLPPGLRNNAITDPTIVREYAKGMPIVTDDYTAYKQTDSEKESTTYIEHASVDQSEFSEYVVLWKEFLKPHTARTLKNSNRWIVPFKKKK